MRTTVDLEEDALAAVREMARRENASLGKVISRLVRQALTGGGASLSQPDAPAPSVTGFQPFEPRGTLVSNELIDHLRDTEGV